MGPDFSQGRIRTSKSVMDETVHFFIGEDLAELKLDSDEAEFIQVQPFPLKKVVK